MRTLRAIGVIGSAAALLLSATVVFAQGQGVGASRAKANSEQTTIATSTQKEKGETARERMQTLREAARTNTAAEREGVAARVAEMQDKAKQTMAQKLTSQFENINTVWTDHFMNLLDRYDAILQKIQARATIASGKGKDVTAVNTAVQSAKNAIADAQIAVTEQAAKTYTPDIFTDSTTAATTTPSGQEGIMKSLRAAFKELHLALFQDLFTLRDGQMKTVRALVQSAFQALEKVPGVDEGNTTTGSESNQ